MDRISVSQLNMLISRELALSPRLNKIEVEAEIGRLTRHGSGHYYFNIKDHYSSIDCVMYRSSVANNPYDFQEGDRVLLRGSVSFYEKTGRLQFYVQRVEPLGEGELLKAFLELRDRFSQLGLLDPERKKNLPRLPEKIALLTSPTGAAYEDFMKIFSERNPFCEVVLYPITVQGSGAVSSIMDSLENIEADLLVLTRGGGSYEDLSVFNDESLCLALANLEIPSLCAIGHEIDFTLAELVCDARGATPSQAAEMASEEVLRLADGIMSRLEYSGRNLLLELDKRRLRIASLMDRMNIHFEHRMVNDQRRIEELLREVSLSFNKRLDNDKRRLEELFQKIQAYNPEEILKRGYVAIKQEGWVRRRGQLVPGPAELHFYDGIEKVEIS